MNHCTDGPPDTIFTKVVRCATCRFETAAAQAPFGPSIADVPCKQLNMITMIK